MNPDFPIREPSSDSDFAAIEQLQRDVWGFSDLDVIPAMYFRSVLAAGGVLLSAYEKDEAVAFVFGFPSWRNRRLALHSDMLAVKSGYRDRGLGLALKLAQRQRCLDAGIETMTWTFDPLRSRNAHFNFAKLGVLCDSYRVNFYGGQTSSMLHSNGTDRLWVTWLLNREPRSTPYASEALRVQIPHDIDRETPQMAAQWRATTREALSKAMTDGYVITGFQGSYYILEKGSLRDFES